MQESRQYRSESFSVTNFVNLGATISREQQRPEPVTCSRHNETNSRRVDVEQSSLGRQRERSTAVKPPLTSTTQTFKRGRRYRTTRASLSRSTWLPSTPTSDTVEQRRSPDVREAAAAVPRRFSADETTRHAVMLLCCALVMFLF